MSDVPFDDSSEFDDYEIGAGVADGKTTEEIIKDNSFPPIPKGRNLFFVKQIALKKDPETHRVLYSRYSVYVAEEEGGEATLQQSITCKDIVVTWAMVDDDRLTLNQYLRAIPDDADEAEIFAMSARKEKGKIGNDYNMLRHVVGALGFQITDGSIPVEAQRLGNWKMWPDGEPRIVSLDITEQIDKDTKKPSLSASGQPYMQIRFFSHQMSEDTKERLCLSDGTQLDVKPPPAPEPAPRQAPRSQAAPPKSPPKSAPSSQAAANKKRAF